MINTQFSIQKFNNYNNVVSFSGAPKCLISKCKADCCYNAPIPRYLLDVYKDKVVNPVHGFYEMDNLPEQGGIQGIAITNLINKIKNKCPFLTKECKCNIYDNRPQICREYGTSKDKSSTLHCNLTI